MGLDNCEYLSCIFLIYVYNEVLSWVMRSKLDLMATMDTFYWIGKASIRLSRSF